MSRLPISGQPTKGHHDDQRHGQAWLPASHRRYDLGNGGPVGVWRRRGKWRRRDARCLGGLRHGQAEGVLRGEDPGGVQRQSTGGDRAAVGEADRDHRPPAADRHGCRPGARHRADARPFLRGRVRRRRPVPGTRRPCREAWLDGSPAAVGTGDRNHRRHALLHPVGVRVDDHAVQPRDLRGQRVGAAQEPGRVRSHLRRRRQHGHDAGGRGQCGVEAGERVARDQRVQRSGRRSGSFRCPGRRPAMDGLTLRRRDRDAEGLVRPELVRRRRRGVLHEQVRHALQRPCHGRRRA